MKFNYIKDIMKTKLQTKIDISTVYFKQTFNWDENTQQTKNHSHFWIYLPKYLPAFWRFEYERFCIFSDVITQLIPQGSVILSEIENDIREHHKTHYSVIHVHVSTTTRLREDLSVRIERSTFGAHLSYLAIVKLYSI